MTDDWRADVKILEAEFVSKPMRWTVVQMEEIHKKMISKTLKQVTNWRNNRIIKMTPEEKILYNQNNVRGFDFLSTLR